MPLMHSVPPQPICVIPICRDYNARHPTRHVPTHGFSVVPRFPDPAPPPSSSSRRAPRTSNDGAAAARHPRVSSDGLRPCSPNSTALMSGGLGGQGGGGLARGRAARASISGGGDLPSSSAALRGSGGGVWGGAGNGAGPRGVAPQLMRQYQNAMQASIRCGAGHFWTALHFTINT